MGPHAPDLWLELPAQPESVAFVRQAIAGVCEALDSDLKVLADVKLAVTEACTNAVVHAYRNGQGDASIQVEATPEDDSHLAVTVRDRGRGVRPRADSSGLGLGLPLMAALSSSVEIGDGPDGTGTEVLMTFALSGGAGSEHGEVEP